MDEGVNKDLFWWWCFWLVECLLGSLHILYTILLDIGARRDRDSVAQRGRGGESRYVSRSPGAKVLSNEAPLLLKTSWVMRNDFLFCIWFLLTVSRFLWFIQFAGIATKCRAWRDSLLGLGGHQRPAPTAGWTAGIALQRTGRSGPTAQ